MPLDDVLVVVLRLIAVAGLLMGFGPSLTRLFTTKEPELLRSRAALVLLLIAFGGQQVYIVYNRIMDAPSPLATVVIAGLSAIAGIAVAVAFSPLREGGHTHTQ